MTYREFQQKIQGELATIYEKDEAESMSRLLLDDAAGMSRSSLRAKEQEEMPEAISFKVYRYLQGLLKHQPIQYVMGYAWFFKRKFKVNPSVLIPRRETEELVYRVIREMKGRKVSILDIGTGSGCIAISLKLDMHEAELTAMDFSEEALKTAKENAAELDADVNFIKGDILKAAEWNTEAVFDVIVSNPPYITEKEKGDMHKNVLEHEPYQALFVSDQDPLQFYKAIADFSVTHLKSGGYLFLECNESYAEAVADFLAKKGFENIEVQKDMQGKDRIVQAQKK